MHIKTIDEEIPVTKEGLLIFIKGLRKELAIQEPIVNRLKLVLKKSEEILTKLK